MHLQLIALIVLLPLALYLMLTTAAILIFVLPLAVAVVIKLLRGDRRGTAGNWRRS